MKTTVFEELVKMRIPLRMTMFIFGILFLTQLSGVLAQTGNGVVDAGLNAGVELAKGVAAMDFTSTMGKLLTKASPFFGMIGPVIDMISLLTGLQEESEQMKFLRTMLATIENRFDRVDRRLDEISQKIDWTKSQIQFYEYERRILALKLKLDKIYNAKNKLVFASYKALFIIEYENMYQESGSLLYEHIVSGEFIFGGNILEEAIKGNNYNRRDVQSFMLGLTKLILMAGQIELAYHKIRYPSTLDNLENEWASRINNMRKAMQDADNQIVYEYMDTAESDAKRILMHNKGKSHKYVGNKIYDHLVDKFYWRNWLVVVYDDIWHPDNHLIGWCSGTAVFRYHGFNLMLADTDENTPALDYDKALQKLSRPNIFKRSVWWGTLYPRGAKSIFIDLHFDCRNYPGAGVIKASADPFIQSANRRCASVKRYPYYLFLFR